MVNINGEWYYDEYAKGAGVTSVGMQQQESSPSGAQPSSGSPAPGAGIQVLPPSDERKRILDLFKN